jgi:phosphate transport system protein
MSTVAASRRAATALRSSRAMRSMSSLSRRHPAKALPEEVNGYSPRWGGSQSISATALKTSCCQETDRADELANDDDDMDHLHRHVFSVLMDTQWKHGVAAVVDVTLLGRYYERFADHAVEIGRRVVFQVTGESTV